MEIIQLPVGSLATNCFLIINSDNEKCIIIDPGGDSEKIISSMKRQPGS